jgi:hypothetical protein
MAFPAHLKIPAMRLLELAANAAAAVEAAAEYIS